jgi:hypothetical protein
MRKSQITALAVTFGLLAATASQAALESDCNRARYKAAIKYESCARKKDLAEPSDSGCLQKYAANWPKLQLKFEATSCALARFVDNGDGTVTDNLTNLVWEQKTNSNGIANYGDLHDADNTYTYSTDLDGDADGIAFTAFYGSLNNGACFAGQCDWRPPTAAELRTILLPESYPCTTNPCVSAEFLPSQSEEYGSATVGQNQPNTTWCVNFTNGTTMSEIKTASKYYRAVRGGF